MTFPEDFIFKLDSNELAGENKIKTFNLPSTRHTKSFCAECGSAVPVHQMENKLLVVPAGSLNTEINMIPTAHIFCSSRASWSEGLESIKNLINFRRRKIPPPIRQRPDAQ